MVQKSIAAAARRPFHPAALALLAISAPLPLIGAAPLVSEAQARAPRGPQQIGGTWEAVWQNSQGAPRKGLIVVQQRGTQLTARIESHGNVTAVGTIDGQFFTLRGTRMGVPFTITGRVQGRKMSGTLNALFIERPFTATRRQGR